MPSLQQDSPPALDTPRPGAPLYLVWAAWLSAGAGVVAAAILAYDVSLGLGPGMRTAIFGGSIMIGLLVLQALTAIVFAAKAGWRRPDRGRILWLLAVPLLVFAALFVAVRLV